MFLESGTSTPLIGWSITVEKAESIAKRGRKLWKVAFEEQFRMFQKETSILKNILDSFKRKDNKFFRKEELWSI